MAADSIEAQMPMDCIMLMLGAVVANMEYRVYVQIIRAAVHALLTLGLLRFKAILFREAPQVIMLLKVSLVLRRKWGRCCP